MISHGDVTLLANNMNDFIEMVRDLPGYAKRHDLTTPAVDLDAGLFGAACWVVGSAYIRGKGLKMHPASKTKDQAGDLMMEMVSSALHEARQHPESYPALAGVAGRGLALEQVDYVVRGKSPATPPVDQDLREELIAKHDFEHIGEVDQALLQQLRDLPQVELEHIAQRFRLALLAFASEFGEDIISTYPVPGVSPEVQHQVNVRGALAEGFVLGVRFGRTTKEKVFADEEGL